MSDKDDTQECPRVGQSAMVEAGYKSGVGTGKDARANLPTPAAMPAAYKERYKATDPAANEQDKRDA